MVDLMFKLAIVPAILFAVEMGVMYLLHLFSLENSPIAPVLDSAILTLVMAPFIYLLFIKPMRGELQEKKELITSKEKIYRTLLTVSNCNQALVRANNEQQIMDDVCRVLTETGGYRMAWVGLAEHDVEKTVRPAAYSGHNEGYVEMANITWADTERGHSPVGTAIRTNKPVVCRDVSTDPFFGAWRVEAAKRGYRSSAAIPLADGETVLGSLNIYSDELDTFDAEEIRLLTELAGDLSFGMRHHRIKEEGERAQHELNLGYRIAQIFLTVPDDKMFADVLDVMLDVMKSKYGIFGYVNEAGDIVCPSMTRNVYEKCNMPEKTIVFPRDTWGGLWGRSLLERKTLYSNSPYRVPDGHIPITRSISTPIVYQDKLVGHLHVANKESDYDERDIRLMDILAGIIGPVLASKLEKQAHEAIRIKAESVIKAAEARYRAFFGQSPFGVVILDPETALPLEFNDVAYRQLGYTREEFATLRVGDYEVKETPEETKRHFAEVLKEGSASFETKHRQKGGGIRDISINVKTITIDGKPAFYCIFQDTTERKRAEMALRSANEELKTALANVEKTNALIIRQEKLASIGTLSSGVAHEILNPLNIIGTIVQIMQMDEWPEDTKKRLDEIMTQVKRATKITNNLRMFAHVHKREITAVDVHALFDKTATLIEHDLNLDNIMMERDYDQRLPLIFVDQDLLAQVFLNLLTNARHALQEVKDGGKKLISVKTGLLDNVVEIHISNNGPCIPENIINKIFDPFFTTKDPDKGTGLGLSMAYSFIKDFGGTITVQNEMPEGVTFIIALPVKGAEHENTGG